MTRHFLYGELGATDAERQAAYRTLFDQPLEDALLTAIRRATNGGWPLGNDRFKQEIARALKRRVAPRAAGRPPNARPDKRQTHLF